MNKRILLAGVAAGLALFAWEAVAHMATPLGAAGFKSFPDEPAMLTTLKANFQESGLYFYPTPKEMGGNPVAGSPTGLLLINRHASLEMNPAQFGFQLLFDIAAMLLAAYIVAQTGAGAGFGSQLLIVLLLSLFSSLRAGLPMWNWYGFPRKYIAAQFAIDFVGFLVGGLIVAKLVTPRAKSMSAAA
jgi:hypothetical protein